MPEITPEQIQELLTRTRERGTYERKLLTFFLNREPTDAEVDALRADFQLRNHLHHKWVEAQPWHTRKRYVSRETRLRTILTKRYNVPEPMVEALVDEISERYQDDW